MHRRAEDGFTLAETLIALFVVSMAMGCVLAGFALLSRFERTTQGQIEARHANEAASANLSQAVTQGQIIAPKGFAGDEGHLDYACGQGSGPDNPKLCTLKWPTDLRLGFVSGGRIYKAWPQSRDTNSAQLPEALILQTAAGTTVSVVRIEAEQGRDCQFDTVSRTCRGETTEKP